MSLEAPVDASVWSSVSGEPGAATARRWGVIAGLPIVAFLAALAHYGARGQYVFLLMNEGVDLSGYGTATTGGFFLGVLVFLALTPLLGGGAVAALGLLATAVGHGIAGAGGVSVGVVLANAGRVGLSVGLPCLAARLFLGRREGAIAAICVAIYAAVNAGAFLSNLLFGAAGQALGPTPVVLACAALSGVVGLLGLGLPVAEYLLPAPGPDEGRVAWSPIVLGVSAAALAVGALAWGVDMAATDLGWTLNDPSTFSSSLAFAANPLGAVVVGVLAAVALAGASAAGFEVPALGVAGLGLVVAAVGFALTGLGPSTLLLGQALSGAGEPLVWGGFITAMTRGVHRRLAPVGPLAMQAVSLITSPLTALVGPTFGMVATLIAAGILAVLGLVALGAAWPVRSLLARVWATVPEDGSVPSVAPGADSYGFPANP